MSRSIHVTIRELVQLGRSDWRSQADKRARTMRALKQLSKKRSIKQSVRRERASVRALPIVEKVPVRVLNSGRFVHYPASASDIDSLIARLPRGSVDGLQSIEFSLGTDDQEDVRQAVNRPLVRDPYVGRLAVEAFEGVFYPLSQGSYRYEAAAVCLSAIVYDPSNPLIPSLEWFLKYRMLSTLVHELAHHHDFTTQVARGRWRADDARRCEDYARRIQVQWTKEYVVPYLRERHYVAMTRLMDWVESQRSTPRDHDDFCSAEDVGS